MAEVRARDPTAQIGYEPTPWAKDCPGYEPWWTMNRETCNCGSGLWWEVFHCFYCYSCLQHSFLFIFEIETSRNWCFYLRIHLWYQCVLKLWGISQEASLLSRSNIAGGSKQLNHDTSVLWSLLPDASISGYTITFLLHGRMQLNGHDHLWFGRNTSYNSAINGQLSSAHLPRKDSGSQWRGRTKWWAQHCSVQWSISIWIGQETICAAMSHDNMS